MPILLHLLPLDGVVGDRGWMPFDCLPVLLHLMPLDGIVDRCYWIICQNLSASLSLDGVVSDWSSFRHLTLDGIAGGLRSAHSHRFKSVCVISEENANIPQI